MLFTHAIATRIENAAERVERERAEFNYNSIRAWLSRGCKVLDVGAWNCYLGETLRDKMACDVMSVDVVNANKTRMPFRLFDGRTLPAEPKSHDAILLLYVLHHAADDEVLLNEAHRVLRDGGRLLVAEDNVEGPWNWMLTVGFHIWLALVARMDCSGKFRTACQWQSRFEQAGFRIKETIPLGHHLRRFWWPENVLFVLEKSRAVS